MTIVHGQLDGRAARIQRTSAWLGATPLTDFGERYQEDEGEYEVSHQVVHETVQQIRVAIQSGHGCVRVGERHRPTAEAIAAALTAEERPHVLFDLDNVMPPEPAELAEPAPSVIAGRDIIRRRTPNIVKLEDGTLRPL